MGTALGGVRQSVVAQAEQGAVLVRREGDLDRRGAGSDLGVALPTPGHHYAVGRINLSVDAAREVRAVHIDPERTAWLRVELGADAHPLDELRGVREEG